VTDAGSDIEAAADRVDQTLGELELLDMTLLSRLSLSMRDVEDRAPEREIAVRAAERAGLGILLSDARRAARDYMTNIFDTTPFRAIGVDLAESRSRASVDDRVAAAAAAEDAVIAAVADPFLTDDVRDRLTTPFEQLRPAWDEGDPLPPALATRHLTVTRWSTYVVFGVLVVGSLVLIALGSGVGTFGLAAAIGIALVALVVRGRSAS
jgi:hypothetical protein